jgi:uncharacterized protein
MIAAPHLRLRYSRDRAIYAPGTVIGRCRIRTTRGREFENWRRLGLLPKRDYRVLVHPDEMRRALPTFDGAPLLLDHPDHPRSRPVGEVFNVRMDGCWIIGDVDVTDPEAADMVRSGERRELSIGFGQQTDWTPGHVGGRRYDGIARDICGRHVALVEQGRAGPEAAIYL